MSRETHTQICPSISLVGASWTSNSRANALNARSAAPPAPTLINASSVGACSGRATTLAKRILQDVLGKGRVAHSTFQVPQKRTVVLEQRGDLHG